MTSLGYDIKDKLNRLNAFEKIIGLNIAVFLIGLIIGKANKTASALSWLELPKDFFDFIAKPWTILTYGFAHYGFIHILFNLLVLYFVSRLLLNLIDTKRSLSIYFLGIIIGGLSFLLVFNVLPNKIVNHIGPLVGASAGVRALLIFVCTYMPNKEARFFAITIKLWHIGLAIVVLDVLGLFSINAGGNVAHLGGSLLGYLYASQLQKGTDIGAGFQRFTDAIANLFKTKSPLRTVHKKKKKPFVGHNKTKFDEFNNQKKIDLILDKISKSGYESLNAEEKTFLFKAGKD
ncbi:rhomboid family intramembrane serine protease [Flavobacteriales bacterium 34_180_T64]|nr:rhomboid family intramembrane serine protease [Flavobacteriales bacterium 34_180_T64]